MVGARRGSAPIVIGRDHLDSGSVASPNRETEAMQDGSDAVSDWPLLNALLNTASGATWVSLHHGGGVGMGYSQHAGMVIVADGTAEAARRLERVLWNDPGTGVMRHADAGYEDAIACAREQGLDLPMVGKATLSNPQLSMSKPPCLSDSAGGRTGLRQAQLIGSYWLSCHFTTCAVTLDQLRAIWSGGRRTLPLTPGCDRGLFLARWHGSWPRGARYGNQHRFRLLSQTRIPHERLASCQRKSGPVAQLRLGEALKPEVVRLVMALKVGWAWAVDERDQRAWWSGCWRCSRQTRCR
jgi:hypothetical protein